MDEGNYRYVEEGVRRNTVERGETINVLGMTVRIDLERKRAVINQKHFLDNLIGAYGIT